MNGKEELICPRVQPLPHDLGGGVPNAVDSPGDLAGYPSACSARGSTIYLSRARCCADGIGSRTAGSSADSSIVAMSPVNGASRDRSWRDRSAGTGHFGPSPRRLGTTIFSRCRSRWARPVRTETSGPEARVARPRPSDTGWAASGRRSGASAPRRCPDRRPHAWIVPSPDHAAPSSAAGTPTPACAVAERAVERIPLGQKAAYDSAPVRVNPSPSEPSGAASRESHAGRILEHQDPPVGNGIRRKWLMNKMVGAEVSRRRPQCPGMCAWARPDGARWRSLTTTVRAGGATSTAISTAPVYPVPGGVQAGKWAATVTSLSWPNHAAIGSIPAEQWNQARHGHQPQIKRPPPANHRKRPRLHTAHGLDNQCGMHRCNSVGRFSLFSAVGQDGPTPRPPHCSSPALPPGNRCDQRSGSGGRTSSARGCSADATGRSHPEPAVPAA